MQLIPLYRYTPCIGEASDEPTTEVATESAASMEVSTRFMSTTDSQMTPISSAEAPTDGQSVTGAEISGNLSTQYLFTTMGIRSGEENSSLTTLIGTVVAALVVSAIVVVTAIILFRCVWKRLHQKKKQHLDLTSPTSEYTNTFIYMHVSQFSKFAYKLIFHMHTLIPSALAVCIH